MRRFLFYSIIAILLFLFVFFKSDTWKTYQKMEVRGGLEYYVTEHDINWDRFFEYMKDIPKNNRETIIGKYLRKR